MMGKKYDFDYIVIGSGPAGTTAAYELARAKKSVAIVEARFFGGSDIGTRDIPYRASLDFSHTYAHMLNFPEVKDQSIRFHLPTIPARQYQVVAASSNLLQQRLKSQGVTFLTGVATFLDPHTISIGEKKYTANNFIIATGSRPRDGLKGSDTISHFLPATAIRITRLPRIVAVIGGGPSGVEIAEYYAELGIKVLLFEKSTTILPNYDIEVGDTLTHFFTENLGISVLTECEVIALEQDEHSKCVVFRYQGTAKMVRVDTLVVAIGGAPYLAPLALEKAKVKYNSKGIKVNKFFETSTRNIYAIGDCIGEDSSTDRATYDGLTLATNLVNKTHVAMNPRGLVRTINTYPEVACLGYTEQYLLSHKRKYQKSLIPLRNIPASRIYNFEYGFIKLLAERSGLILGATIVAPEAEHIISELALAFRHNLTTLEIASTPHSQNSYNYLIKVAAKDLLKKKKTREKPKVNVKIVQAKKTKKSAPPAKPVKKMKPAKIARTPSAVLTKISK